MRVLAKLGGATTMLAVGALVLVPLAGATVWRGTSLNALGFGEPTSTQQLDANHQAGANAVRIDIGWTDLQPVDKDHFDAGSVAKYDAYLQKAADRGLKVIAIVQSTPCWASSAPVGENCGPYPPTDDANYARAVAYIADRWGSKLAAIEVWNEPNNQTSWRSTGDWVADYAALLKAAYPAIKQKVPNLPVLGGSLLFSHDDTLNELYDDGIHGYFDAIAIHPYDDPSRDTNDVYSLVRGIPHVRDSMVFHGDGDKALWLTEFGWPTCAPDPQPFAWCVSEDGQTTKLTNEFEATRAWSYIGATIIYNLRDDATGSSNWQSNMGLLHSDFTPKPAFAAFQHEIAALDSPAPPPPAALPPPTTLQLPTTLPLVHPAVSGLQQSASTWRVGTGLARISARRVPTGTTFSFRLNMAASVRLDFTQRVPGRRVRGRCTAPSRANRRKPRCTRAITFGALHFDAHAGTNQVRFQGRLSTRRTLAPGRHTVTITAADASGKRSAPRTLSFTIVR